MIQRKNTLWKALTALTLAAAMTASAVQAAAPWEEREEAEPETPVHLPLTVLNDNGLPVVYLTIDESAEGYGTIQEMNDSPDHTVRCTGTVRIDVPEGYTGDYSEDVLQDTEELALEYIRGRGNITWTADKKAYKFKLDKKSPLLGMGKNKHWALMANRFDGSMIRNRLVSYIGEQMGFAYTPKMLPVDLVINGEYAGSYYLAETVRIGKNRVNIDELTPEDNEAPAVTGGYLLGLNPFSFIKEYPYENILTTPRQVRFWLESPDCTDEEAPGTPEQKAYIYDYLTQTEEAVFGADFQNASGTPYTDLMDVDSAVDFWWVQEFLLNEDAFDSTSNYLYKEREGKLVWGPLWDFDYSMGTFEPTVTGFNAADMPWLDHLREHDPAYQQRLRERWTVLDGIITDIVKDGGVLDRYAQEVEASARDDEQRWRSCDQFWRERYDFSEEVRLVRSWLSRRQGWVREHIDDDLTHVHSTVTFTDGDKVLYSTQITTEDELWYLPDAPDRSRTFLGWADEQNYLYESGVKIMHDVTLSPRYAGDPQPTALPIDPYDDGQPTVHPGLPAPIDYSETSQTSDTSDISQTSGTTQTSDTSTASELSESSDTSQETQPPSPDTSETPEVPDSSAPSERSETAAPAENESTEPSDTPPLPPTGETSALPLCLTAIGLSLAVINLYRRRDPD